MMREEKPLVPRRDFPSLEKYTYLNSASISLMPLPVLEEMESYGRGILYAGTVSLDEEAEVLALDGAREGAARLLGVDAGDGGYRKQLHRSPVPARMGDPSLGQHRQHRHRVPERRLPLGPRRQGVRGRGPARAGGSRSGLAEL